MGFFDWVPTPIEVIEWVHCRLSDHNWVKNIEGNFFCSECGKEK